MNHVSSEDGPSDRCPKMRPPHGRTTGPTRRSTKGKWTAEEDEILSKAVQRFKGKNWKKIAECFKDRTDVQCLHRWQKVLNPELVKGPWSKEEDEVIIQLVSQYGAKKWSTIAQHLPGRMGKQCRERWYNHLNPTINRDAWTQEEELALIRAHQIYGNKWAELTKFLPGRTDNSIKNHWNSSVKKKAESYIASGLLSEFQGLPHVENQNQSISPPASRMQQSSGDEGNHNEGNELDDISECSQGSSPLGCSQTANDITNSVLQARNGFMMMEYTSQIKQERCSPAESSEAYFASIEEVNLSIPETQVNCSLLEQNPLHKIDGLARDDQYNFTEFPGMSLHELGQDQSYCATAYESNEMLHMPYPCSSMVNTSTSSGSMVLKSEKLGNFMVPENASSSCLQPNTGADGCISSHNSMKFSNAVNMDGHENSFISQPSNIQITDTTGTSALQSTFMRSDIVGNSSFLSTSCSPSLLCANEGHLWNGCGTTEFGNLLSGTQEDDLDDFMVSDDLMVPSSSTGAVHTDHDGNADKTHSRNYMPEELVAQSTDCTQSCPVLHELPEETNEGRQQDGGSLCYEPPRFPSLDVPFFSCDLVQSSSDMQQEYSPLGIRQLMMSPSCFTPFRLWDLPSRENSPDALSKSAAKTFTSTPSILKKRQRDLLSPLSDRRRDKKLDSVSKQNSFSSLARDFSNLDVMFQEHAACATPNQKRDSGASGDDKENMDPALTRSIELEKGGSGLKKDHRLLNVREKMSNDDPGQGSQFDADPDVQTLEKSSEVFAEEDLENISPDQVGLEADKVLVSRAWSNQPASENQQTSVSNSPSVNMRNNVTGSFSKFIPSSSLNTVINNTTKDVGIENINIFCGTPFKRSFESPSAWKSPCFMNSFIPGPRIDTDITIEDIGYFLSLGERSNHALGLMEQVSERSAAAFADAHEISGNHTPKTILREKRSDIASPGHPAHHDVSDVLIERRVLDFSECETPCKDSNEVRRGSPSLKLHSPSAYLLKGCR